MVGFLIVLVVYWSAMCSFQLRVRWWRSLVVWTVERSYMCSIRLGVEWVSGSVWHGRGIFCESPCEGLSVRGVSGYASSGEFVYV